MSDPDWPDACALGGNATTSIFRAMTTTMLRTDHRFNFFEDIITMEYSADQWSIQLASMPSFAFWKRLIIAKIIQSQYSMHK
jgi:hypothetical protein